MGFYTLSYLGFALAQAALAIWGFRVFRQNRTVGALMILLPIATVWYDNLIIALGSYIGAGTTLETLTMPRFLGHSLFTPAWIVGGTYLAGLAGAFGRSGKNFRAGAWILYGIMVLVGLLNEVFFYKGALATEGDVLFYTNVGRLWTPPPPSLAMLVVVLISGALVLWKTRGRWPWMLLSALIVLASQAARGGEAAFFFTNLGEVAMSAALIATLVWLRKRNATSPGGDLTTP